MALPHEKKDAWRIIVALLEDARTPETRQRRLASIVERLAENATRHSKKNRQTRIFPGTAR